MLQAGACDNCIPDLDIELVHAYVPLVLGVHVLGQVVDLELSEQLQGVECVLEVSQCEPLQPLHVVFIADHHGCASLSRVDSLLDNAESALGLGLILHLLELHVDQSDEVELSDLRGVVLVPEVVSDRTDLIVIQRCLHVLLEGGRELLRGQALVLVAIIVLEELGEVDVELLDLGSQGLDDVLDGAQDGLTLSDLSAEGIAEVLEGQLVTHAHRGGEVLEEGVDLVVSRFLNVLADEALEVGLGHATERLVSAKVVEDCLQRHLASREDALDLLDHVGH